jgi:phage terminase large subunit GpA-like protein
MPDGNLFSEVGVIPSGTVAVTLGIDSQSDGFYWLLSCWGRKMETWLPLTDRIVGDMRSDATWKTLEQVLAMVWLDKEGNACRPVISALDVQGDFYPECLEFVRANRFKYRLHAVRGYAVSVGHAAGRGQGILRNRFLDKTTGVQVTNVDVDIAKNTLANMLARKEPGPGFVHLPCGPHGEDVGGWDQETISELTAEYRRQTNLRGYTVSRWYKKSGRPNHRGDCFVYALAALALSRLKIDDCELKRIEARNVGKLDEREKNRERSPFGARRMIHTRDLVSNELPVGGTTGFGVADRPWPTGWGAMPGSGISW